MGEGWLGGAYTAVACSWGYWIKFDVRAVVLDLDYSSWDA